jgi:hypothetical protein
LLFLTLLLYGGQALALGLVLRLPAKRLQCVYQRVTQAAEIGTLKRGCQRLDRARVSALAQRPDGCYLHGDVLIVERYQQWSDGLPSFDLPQRLGSGLAYLRILLVTQRFDQAGNIALGFQFLNVGWTE